MILKIDILNKIVIKTYKKFDDASDIVIKTWLMTDSLFHIDVTKIHLSYGST